jgi:5'-nucleotidase
VNTIHRTGALLAALSLLGCVEPLSGAAAPSRRIDPRPPAPCLSIVAWNDLHGQLSPDDPVVDTGRVPAGGVVALADQVAAIRATGDSVVALDAGDLFTGPLESTLAEGAPVIDAYEVLGLDAVAIGNHEFDFGPAGYERVTAPAGTGDQAGVDGPRGALLARMASASFPFLSANIRLAGGGLPAWPNLKPWARIRRGSYDVGVVGYTTQETPGTTLRSNVSDLDFTTAAVPAVRDAMRALRAFGSAPVVLLAHASLEGELPQRLEDDGARTGELASLMEALGPDVPDVIVAGHRHAWMVGRVRGVPIVASDQHGVGLSRIRYCPLGGGVKLESIERVVVLAAVPPRSALGARVAAAVMPWQERVSAEAEARIATLPRACAAQAPAGTALAEQVARALVERIADAAAPPKGVPVVGIVNGGALRAPLAAGPLRFADLFAALPFENAVSACSTTRGGLKRLIENALTRDSAREKFPFGIAGAKVRVKRGPGGALTLAGVEIAGQPKGASDDAPVWLSTSDFVLLGGDGLMDGVTCAASAVSSTQLRAAWRAVLAREQGGCDGATRSVVME